MIKNIFYLQIYDFKHPEPNTMIGCILMFGLWQNISQLFQSSQNRLLIKNGRVVNDDGMEDSDVYIEDGIIK